jgi:hypothetical protein
METTIRFRALNLSASLLPVVLALQPLQLSSAPTPPTPKYGATVPFLTVETEDSGNRLVGGAAIVRMTTPPGPTTATPEMEASGRGFVALTAIGDALQLSPITQRVNTLLLRHCIPDAPTGDGITATLSLYVNGKFRQKLTLSSKHNWLYGKAGENGQSNDTTAGQAHVFWDESRFILSGGALKPGDTIRLQKDSDDTATFYRLDLVDLEEAPPPKTPPRNQPVLDVTKPPYNANGNDDKDDTDALQHCIDDAKSQNKTVWLPRGTFYQSRKLTLDGVHLQGAGMWYTQLIGTVLGTGWGGNVGFTLQGDGPTISDLFVDCPTMTRRGQGGKPFTGNPTHWRIENVWITHTNTGLWIDGSGGIVRNCRVRFTYADAINLNRSAHDNLVENNHIRGNGDDGIALLSEMERNPTPAARNIVRKNTVSALWWGHNGDLAGGSDQLFEDNLFVDNAKLGCFTINLPGAFPMYPLSHSIVRRNRIVRGGGMLGGQKRGAVWLYAGSTSATGIRLEDNRVEQAVFRAIHLTGSHPQELSIVRNIIEQPGEDGIVIEEKVTGSAVFTNNQLRGLNPKFAPVVNRAGADFTLKQSGNSWVGD